MIKLFSDSQALEQTSSEEMTALTQRATDATYYADGLSRDQIKSIERVVGMSAECAAKAAANPSQHLVAAMHCGSLAGFAIATIHSQDDRELDWIMVAPELHGSGMGSALLEEGIKWLGRDRTIWLNVIQHNQRAISFYTKHGFVIDPDAETTHAIPHYIMRRRPDSSA